MSSRVLRHLSALAVATAVAGLMAGAVAAQSQAGKSSNTTFKVPRTPDGKPDLQGNWSNNSVTPLQRPEAWKNKTTLNDQELTELKKLVAQVTEDGGDAQFGDEIIANALAGKKNVESSDSGTGNYNHFWLVERTVDDRRTALLTDPPDGRLPTMTKDATDRQAAAAQARRGRRLDNPEERGVGERCVNFGVPKMGAGYNSYYQIVQTPTHVVMLSEMAHDARIIPIGNQPFPDKKIQNWNGEARGHWEGDTLVVESKNFSPKSDFRGSRENLHLIERFTRVGPTTLNYEITVDDPTVWTRQWTAMVPFQRTDDQIYEYACHEGNYRSMEGSLKGTRVVEQEATRTGTTSRQQ